MERRIDFIPGSDRRLDGQGNSAMRIEFAVIDGQGGALSFNIHTGMYPLHLHREWNQLEFGGGGGPSCRFIGYHSRIRLSENDEYNNDDCAFIGGPCYSRFIGDRIGDKVLGRFLSVGIEALWVELELLYEEHVISVLKDTLRRQQGVGL